MDTKELYLKTIFCCMACDGDIAKEEVAFVHEITSKDEIFGDLDVETIINEYIASINTTGEFFLQQYLKELGTHALSSAEQMKIVDLSIHVISTDDKIEYSEVKFFKKIRSRLSLTDEEILDVHPDIEDFLLPDINVVDDQKWSKVVFENIKFTDL